MRLVGHEVGCGDPQAAPRLEHAGEERVVEEIAGHVRPAADHLDGGRPIGRRCRRGCQRFAGSETPVGAEHCGDVCHRRTRHARRNITPASRVRRRPQVFARQVHAADDRLAIVGQDDLAVQSEIRVPAEGHVPDRHEPLELPARRPQRAELPAASAEAEERVEEQTHFDAFAGLGR
jgi:hypothetical protein